MAEQCYLVLIGDLIRSRDADDRAGLQQRLQDCLDTLNQQAGPALVSPYTLTLGDEFQAVRTGTTGLWTELLQIRRAVLPEQVRFSLGLGTLATSINPKQALGMDGPAFHIARDGMEALKHQSGQFALGGLASHDQRWANALLATIDHMTRKWRANRFDILHLLLTGHSPADIAEALGLSVQAVYRNIRDGDLELIMELMQLLDSLLTPALESPALTSPKPRS